MLCLDNKRFGVWTLLIWVRKGVKWSLKYNLKKTHTHTHICFCKDNSCLLPEEWHSNLIFDSLYSLVHYTGCTACLAYSFEQSVSVSNTKCNTNSVKWAFHYILQDLHQTLGRLNIKCLSEWSINVYFVRKYISFFNKNFLGYFLL